jgi:hypothetical protein
MRPAVFLTVAGVAVAGLVYGSWSRLAAADHPIPTAPLQRGRVETQIFAIGDLRAARTLQIGVPPMGGLLTIVALAESGTWPSRRATRSWSSIRPIRSCVEQANFDLKLAEQEMVKAQAEAAAQTADDDVALLEARFAVRRAELMRPRTNWSARSPRRATC